MTRTHLKHYRVYVNGIDFSGQSRTIGALAHTFEVSPEAAMTDEVQNIVTGRADIQAGTLSAFLENDASALFANQAQTTRNLLVAIGANATPVAGDNVFAWKFEDTGYMAEQGTGFVAATLPFGGASYASPLTYKTPWGKLLHAKGTETDVNSSVGIDYNGASSALGGIFIYHLHSSDGTVTLKVQDAATNTDGNFSDLSGATSGSITAAVTPQSGMIALGTTATVRRYLRWQLAFGTATGATFTCAFIRA